MELSEKLDVAVMAVRGACVACRSVLEDLRVSEAVSKADASPVTAADFAAQVVVNHHLRTACPDIPVLAEESSVLLRQPGNSALLARVETAVRRVLPALTGEQILSAVDHGAQSALEASQRWVLDPLDGTKGFLRGGQFAVALALLTEGQPTLAVLGCPNLPRVSGQVSGAPGALLYAVRGNGAWQSSLADGEAAALAADGIDVPSLATWCESVEAAHSSHGLAARVAAALGVVNQPVRMDSQCKYALVARGEASFYLRLPTRPGYREKMWDHAAGALLVHEAGGTVTDAAGRPLDFSSGSELTEGAGVVASNGLLHDDVLSAVAGLRPG